ncbi:hypothetical protein [Flavobacterium sp. HNIBRBA15423]|uniref:hypothetical protein n=1 Tax=Flavobacterium sp. HNIBRBA15423 TaxID=3458683 RepID=UPI004043B047
MPYLEYLGLYTVFIPLFSFIFITLYFIILYCKYKGPNDLFVNYSFYMPMIGSLALGILLFYTSFFWITLGIYTLTFFALHLVSFQALGNAVKDKTSMGVTMFSGLVGMYVFFSCALACFIKHLF